MLVRSEILQDISVFKQTFLQNNPKQIANILQISQGKLNHRLINQTQWMQT